MINYYIEIDNKIILFDKSLENIQNTLAFMPEYRELEIKETERPIIDFKFADTEEYEQEQAQKERERINMLSLTAADVERAIYKAKGMDFEDVITQLSSLEAEQPGCLDMKALKIELKANNFYRGNSYVSQIGQILGFNEEQLDYLFEHGCFEEEEVNDNA